MVMPMNSFGMNSSTMSGGNVFQQMHAKYGCGYIDFAERPKITGYPLGIRPDFIERKSRSVLGEWIHKLFG